MVEFERKLGAFRSPFDDKRMLYALRAATYEEALADVKSAIKFHQETFGFGGQQGSDQRP